MISCPICCTVLDFIGPSPTGCRGQKSSERIFIWIGKADRLNTIAPLYLLIEADESDVIGQLTSHVRWMQNDLIHLKQFGVLAIGIKKIMLSHADLNLRWSSTDSKNHKLLNIRIMNINFF